MGEGEGESYNYFCAIFFLVNLRKIVFFCFTIYSLYNLLASKLLFIWPGTTVRMCNYFFSIIFFSLSTRDQIAGA